jgi:D-serine deaminase-like pyridoxal phosphate-dependent protein
LPLYTDLIPVYLSVVNATKRPIVRYCIFASTMQVTELHPGNFIFYDVQQATYGSCTETDIGIYTLTRVVGHYPRSNTLLIDLGWTGCSKQGPGETRLAWPLRSRRISQHPLLPEAQIISTPRALGPSNVGYSCLSTHAQCV